MGKDDIEVIETYWKSVCKITHFIGKSFPKKDFRYWEIEDFLVEYNHWEDSNEVGEYKLWNEKDLTKEEIRVFFQWVDSENDQTGKTCGTTYLEHRS